MLLEGKTGLIMGIANRRSIAWGIAQSTHNAGARLVLTYQNDRLGENVRKVAPDLGDPLLLPCDVASDDQIRSIDGEHSERNRRPGFSGSRPGLRGPAKRSRGSYADTSREAFQIALDISAYSLAAVARRAAPLMKDRDGSIMTITYLGGERVVAGYNVMGVAKAALEASVRYLANDLGPEGIRVNAISAGPVRTLASSAVSGISGMVRLHAERAPLRRRTEIAEVGDTALFLASSLSRGVTGEVIHVDGGFHTLGA